MLIIYDKYSGGGGGGGGQEGLDSLKYSAPKEPKRKKNTAKYGFLNALLYS